MLLIVTNRDDLTADWLILELEERGVRFARFNTEDYPETVGLAWAPNSGHIDLPETRVQLSKISAAWWRRPVPPVLRRDLGADERAWALTEAREALEGLWRAIDVRWVNHPDRNRAATSKPAQLLVAQQLGFDVPATLMTNDAEEARSFIRHQASGAICKPLRSGRVPVDGEEQVFFTSPIHSTSGSLDRLGAEPYLFQELIPKASDLRVTVIGDEAFAVRIHSQESAQTALDWRASDPAQLRHEAVDLPEPTASRCVELVRRFGCAFGAIDLAERPDGTVTFFENNPSGQWAWIEQLTGLPLRAALTDLLIR